MLSPLSNKTYRNLFIAQVMALLGTGMATVALSLLAHDLAGANSGEILGIALGIKMMAYVSVAPFASALATHVPRKTLLVSLDVVRAGVAAALPFVTEAWQVYGLMTVLYVASAAFTPAFQSMIPDILPDEAEYTKALSLSRLASDLESVASPIVAALLLSIMSYHNLFAGTAIGFVGSAALVLLAALPVLRVATQRPFLQRLTVGFQLFAKTPRLRGLLAISLAEAAGGAMVFVNTVLIVQTNLSLGPNETAWALAVFGFGSMGAAFAVPRLLEVVSDRLLMTIGGVVLTIGLIAGSLHQQAAYQDVLFLWFCMGIGYSLTVTPAGRALRRSSTAEDRPALFAAHFTLSHACWLIAYPTAGLVSANVGAFVTFAVLAAICGAASVLTLLVWPSFDPDSLRHRHDELSADHPHIAANPNEHSHPISIDRLHRRWPRKRDRR